MNNRVVVKERFLPLLLFVFCLLDCSRCLRIFVVFTVDHRGSLVVIATGYRLDGPGIESL
jgi:hypothetical protein